MLGEEGNGLAPAANVWKGIGEWRLQFALCKDFGAFFNIMSALFLHQSLTRPQIFDSREGLFWCLKGVVVNAVKMNFY